jgi:hypothetical protein
MLKPTTNPRLYELRLVDWSPYQPNSTTGVGTRTELVCSLLYTTGSLTVEYLTTDYLERETPVLPWRRTHSAPEPQRSYLEHVVMSAAITELLNALPMRMKWPLQTNNY